ncbi:hypothetical protein [Xanthomonas citri]|uniref:hypothetical protein n=1 Tax=Xanthomonas citri TaxID=346 RepID=UPI00124A300A|nr:hypothetical protein [Xanthomonas citri]QTJ31188.1 hypothetical protein XcfCFBP6975P_24035 [Xanthomonas citri pv. phaseoli var. fuscans]
MSSIRTYVERLLAAIPLVGKWRRESFYRTHLEEIELALEAHKIRQTHFSLSAVTLDGAAVLPDTEVLVGSTKMDSRTFAYLFSIFNGSDCTVEETDQVGGDGAPPGAYVCVSNNAAIGQGHENRIGLYRYRGRMNLNFDGLHIDHIFLAQPMRGGGLGGIMFALCAIASFSVGIDRITLLAAGGHGFQRIYYGYKIWPRYGFDAPLNAGEQSLVQFHKCATVQDLREIDVAWWDANGNQREMEFDLRPYSRSWLILLAYLRDNP